MLSFRKEAQSTAGAANVRAALPAVVAYYADHGTYEGMTGASLSEIDAGISLDPLVSALQTATSYCVESTVAATTWRRSAADEDTIAGTCLLPPARPCVDSCQMLGATLSQPFLSEKECIEYVVAGGRPVAVSAG